MSDDTAVIWRPIPGYEGLYDASDVGQIRSWWTYHGEPGPRLRKLQLNPSGYLHATLHDRAGKSHTFSVHRLVTLAFLGPMPDGMERRHRDGNQLNNAADNLEYCEHSTNIRDQVTHGTHTEASKTHCPQGHKYDERNTYQGTSDKPGRNCRECIRSAGSQYYRSTKGQAMQERRNAKARAARAAAPARRVGAGSPLAKLTEQQLAEIRELLGRGITQAKVAARFGVSRSTISLIKSGKRYAA